MRLFGISALQVFRLEFRCFYHAFRPEFRIIFRNEHLFGLGFFSVHAFRPGYPDTKKAACFLRHTVRFRLIFYLFFIPVPAIGLVFLYGKQPDS